MALAIVYSRAQVGVEAPAVMVEAHLANGLPALTLVGLPEAAVKESKDRVRSAILNCGLDFPARRITLNLAPADLPKDGGYGLGAAKDTPQDRCLSLWTENLRSHWENFADSLCWATCTDFVGTNTPVPASG